jgi:predicted enzyme related to lactoylglutathione lyase
MPDRSTPWPEGTPTWLDLAADDVESATAFYSDLFGWAYESGGEESGGYLLARLDGMAVAGIGPKQGAHGPTAWTTYLAADDADAVVAAVGRAGGQVLAGPVDVMGSGRMAVAMDTVGAVFGIWQAGSHIGAERVDEHGSSCWNELHTRDHDAARRFYAEVFGATFGELFGDDLVYSVLKRASDGKEVAGVYRDDHLLAGVPDHWLAWFASDDADASTARAVELGARVLVPAADSAFGRMSVVEGPQGEAFGLISLPSEP